MKDKLTILSAIACCLFQAGCRTPIGADPASPALAYRQTHDIPIGHVRPSRETQSVLHRLAWPKTFEEAPDEVMRLIHAKAEESRDRGLIYILSELNYLEGERLRRGVKPF